MRGGEGFAETRFREEGETKGGEDQSGRGPGSSLLSSSLFFCSFLLSSVLAGDQAPRALPSLAHILSLTQRKPSPSLSTQQKRGKKGRTPRRVGEENDSTLSSICTGRRDEEKSGPVYSLCACSRVKLGPPGTHLFG